MEEGNPPLDTDSDREGLSRRFLASDPGASPWKLDGLGASPANLPDLGP